jgi:hypothetical protein
MATFQPYTRDSLYTLIIGSNLRSLSPETERASAGGRKASYQRASFPRSHRARFGCRASGASTPIQSRALGGALRSMFFIVTVEPLMAVAKCSRVTIPRPTGRNSPNTKGGSAERQGRRSPESVPLGSENIDARCVGAGECALTLINEVDLEAV